MASRKQQKEQARAERLAQEQARAAKATRTRRLQLFAGVITTAVIVVVVAVVISSSGNSTTPGLAHGKAARTLYKTVNSELAGIPESGTTLGNPKAKVTMTYYGDLECPICQEFTLGVDGGGLPQLISHEVRTGTVKIDYRSMCTATCNDYANGQSIFNDQQSAAYAAGKQNLFWYYAELFYRQQAAEGSGYVTPDFINGVAAEIPKLDRATWQTARKESALTTQVGADELAAEKAGLTGTPSLLMAGPKGNLDVGTGVITYPALQAAIKDVS